MVAHKHAPLQRSHHPAPLQRRREERYNEWRGVLLDRHKARRCFTPQRGGRANSTRGRESNPRPPTVTTTGETLVIIFLRGPPDLEQRVPQHAPPQVVQHHVQPGPEPGALGQPPGQPAVQPCNAAQHRTLGTLATASVGPPPSHTHNRHTDAGALERFCARSGGVQELKRSTAIYAEATSRSLGRGSASLVRCV